MDRFFAILSDGVHRFEGTINQYTGDGIMALFGAPIAHEDHAQRACYAALDLQHELRRYADEIRLEHGLSFSVRMGLNSGEVVVGKIGDDLRMDYTAQGHTVGLAARMEQIAEYREGAPHRVYGEAGLGLLPAARPGTHEGQGGWMSRSGSTTSRGWGRFARASTASGPAAFRASSGVRMRSRPWRLPSPVPSTATGRWLGFKGLFHAGTSQASRPRFAIRRFPRSGRRQGRSMDFRSDPSDRGLYL